MKIRQVELQNFLLFHELNTTFSPSINVISGENSTGKTALIKVLYSCVKSWDMLQKAKGDVTKSRFEEILVSKLQGVYHPSKDSIGRLVYRRPGVNKSDVAVQFDMSGIIQFNFTSKHEKHIELDKMDMPKSDVSAVYIPPKEIISATENFGSLYTDYHIGFEETYYDLARLLERPLKRGANTTEQNAVLKSFGKILDGDIVQKSNAFYLKVKGAGEFEMGLVSEGYRKLATVMYLISSGSLSKNAVLFWDEPETNMNPKMIKPIVDAIIELAKLGVQVFVTTHDYFVQQCFDMAVAYPAKDSAPLDINFIALYKEANGIEIESAKRLIELGHNSVMEEFDALYDREQVLINGY